jgi:hypothetical protein
MVQIGIQAENVKASSADSFTSGIIVIPIYEIHPDRPAELDRALLRFLRQHERSRNQQAGNNEHEAAFTSWTVPHPVFPSMFRGVLRKYRLLSRDHRNTLPVNRPKGKSWQSARRRALMNRRRRSR